MPMVRKARCPMCGSAKSTPTTSAFIYCDYCGQLMDLDLSKYREQVPVPSEAYNKLEHQLRGELEGAKFRRDRKQLEALHRRLQDLWLTDMAAMYSPRVRDPEFRAQLLDYLVYQRVVSDLSETLAPLAEKLEEANAGMEMEEKDGRWLVKGASLWPIVEVQREAALAFLSALENFEDPVRDPDDTPQVVAMQLGQWTYISGWMTMLDDATAKELLRRTGLESGFAEIAAPELHRVFCGHCGAKQERPAGARRVLCESCGKHADIGSPTQCHQCGSQVVIGLGLTAATCAHCQAETRLVPQLT